MSQTKLDFLSTVLLVLGSIVCLGIFGSQRVGRPRTSWYGPEVIWLFASFGMLYLGFDEYFDLHSRYDYWIHLLMNWSETAVSDRIDDVIVGSYVLGAASVFWVNRKELFDATGESRAIELLCFGFGLAGVHVVCDILSNRDDFSVALFGDSPAAGLVHRWISFAEQLSEIGAELLLVGALLLIWNNCFRNRANRKPRNVDQLN